MKSVQLANVALGLLLAAFTASAQMPGAPASPAAGSSNQDQTLGEPSAGPGLRDEGRNATDSPQQDSTPSLPGTSNENKADPTDQNNPK